MTEDQIVKMKYIISEAVKKYGNTRVKLGMEYTERKSTGSVHYDYLLSGGFEAGTIALYYGKTGSGKALPLDNKILTPNGWIKMGDIKVNSIVYDKDGNECQVKGVFPQGIKDIYKISFNDNTSTNCCKDHLWATYNNYERNITHKYSIRNTESIMCGKYSIPYNNIIPFSKKELLLHPYVLGALIGDGELSTMIKFTNAEKDVVDKVSRYLPDNDMLNKFEYNSYRLKRKQYNNNITDTLTHIKKYELDNKKSYEKFIPKDYLYSNIEDRTILLHGLMDTDGYTCKNGNVSYSTTSKQLANDVCFLVRSLGGRAKLTKRHTSYTYKGIKKLGRLSYTIFIWFYNDIIPVTSKKHVTRYKFPRKFNHKIITNIEYIGKQEAQCIMINSPTSLYITDDFVVTHNTTMALRNIAAAQRRGESCAWLRVEKGCNRQYMERIGVDTSKLLIVENLPHGEAYLDILIQLIKEEVDMIIVDSISALVPKREMEESMEKEHPGLQAKVISTMLRKANGVNTKSNVIFISQVRQAFTTGNYTKYLYAGGFAAQHNTDYIVEFKIKDKLSADGKEISSSELKTEAKKDVTGVNMLMYVEKTRRGLAHKVGEMYFNFKTGTIDELGELIRVAIKLDILKYAGGWLKLTDEFKDQWGFSSNSIRHKDLKIEVEKNEPLKTYLIEEIKKYYE